MKVHLSVDDVIYSLKSLAESKPESVFDISIFKELKRLNTEYGVVFSLYAFENYAEEFFINDVPTKYWEEMTSSGIIRLGFHGTFFDSSDDVFFEKCRNFYSVIPKELCTDILRIHRYTADAERINYLKQYGISELLCRENESRLRHKFPESYILNESEESSLDNKVLTKSNMIFRKTNIRLEFYDEVQLKTRIAEEVGKKESDDSEIVIFTHEKYLLDESVSFDTVVSILSEYDIDYIF